MLDVPRRETNSPLLAGPPLDLPKQSTSTLPRRSFQLLGPPRGKFLSEAVHRNDFAPRLFETTSPILHSPVANRNRRFRWHIPERTGLARRQRSPLPCTFRFSRSAAHGWAGVSCKGCKACQGRKKEKSQRLRRARRKCSLRRVPSMATPIYRVHPSEPFVRKRCRQPLQEKSLKQGPFARPCAPLSQNPPGLVLRSSAASYR